GDRGCSGTAKRAGVCARVAHGGSLVRCGRAGLARTTCDDGDYRDSDQHAPHPHHTRIRARYGLAKEGYDRWASPPSAPTPGTGTRALPSPPDAGGRPRPRPCDPRRRPAVTAGPTARPAPPPAARSAARAGAPRAPTAGSELSLSPRPLVAPSAA